MYDGTTIHSVLQEQEIVTELARSQLFINILAVSFALWIITTIIVKLYKTFKPDMTKSYLNNISDLMYNVKEIMLGVRGQQEYIATSIQRLNEIMSGRGITLSQRIWIIQQCKHSYPYALMKSVRDLLRVNNLSDMETVRIKVHSIVTNVTDEMVTRTRSIPAVPIKGAFIKVQPIINEGMVILIEFIAHELQEYVESEKDKQQVLNAIENRIISITTEFINKISDTMQNLAYMDDCVE